MSFLKNVGKKKCVYQFCVHVSRADHLTSDSRWKVPPKVYCKCKRKAKSYQTNMVPINAGSATWDTDLTFMATLFWHQKSGFARKIFIFSVQTALAGLDYSTSLDLSKFARKGDTFTKSKVLSLYPSGQLRLTITSEECVDPEIDGNPKATDKFFFKPSANAPKKDHLSIVVPRTSLSDEKMVPSPQPLVEISDLASMAGGSSHSLLDHKHDDTDDQDTETDDPGLAGLRNVQRIVQAAMGADDVGPGFDEPDETDPVSNALKELHLSLDASIRLNDSGAFSRVMKEIRALPELEKKLQQSDAYKAAIGYYKEEQHRRSNSDLPPGLARMQSDSAVSQPGKGAGSVPSSDPNDAAADSSDISNNNARPASSSSASSAASPSGAKKKKRRPVKRGKAKSPSKGKKQGAVTPPVDHFASDSDDDVDSGNDDAPKSRKQRAQSDNDAEHADQIMDMLKEEYEVRLVWQGREVPIGFIEATPMDNLRATRAAIARELDHVPQTFFFVKGELPKLQRIRPEREERMMLIDAFKGDVLRIGTPGGGKNAKRRQRRSKPKIGGQQPDASRRRPRKGTT